MCIRDRAYIILGMTFMTQVQAVFDMEERKLGLVPSNCSHDYNPILIPLPERNWTIDDGYDTEKTPRMWIVLIMVGGVVAMAATLYVMGKCIKKLVLRARQYNVVGAGRPGSGNVETRGNTEITENGGNPIGMHGDEATLEMDPQ
eukprot:TRINITY_DN11823_c0_g1_i3.p1 TRINITY_DN11823_c0_g1~~TRINITY_DN11823_c0_g1_i3.p1  ORF type:complete len:145 (+),score=33.37 TRINITY_DN11823_c0_g1_i3:65-499(+)